MKKIIEAVRDFIRNRINLDEDRADEQLIETSIRRNIDFKGANLWALIFAILIASIGLNVNSTAVIIGAMLISPLMGPIMGIGLGIGIYDFDLVKRGLKNLAIAAVISIVVSAIYFALSPLDEAKSELLARTTPSIWDVFIAFFGGMAGIIAGSQKEKTNVIPGVAIATALMPPLCTAGFGLATGNLAFFVGAGYLFFINSLFICIATFLVVRHLKFHKKKFSSRQQERKVVRSILFIVTITIIPSIYLAYRIVQRSIFESSAKQYVQNEFHFRDAQVVQRNYLYSSNVPVIELLVIGNELSNRVIDSLEKRLPRYGLGHSKLIVRQGLNAKNQVDLTQIRASILEDVFNSEKLKDTIAASSAKGQTQGSHLKPELQALFPQMLDYSFSETTTQNLQSPGTDTIWLFVGRFAAYPSRPERQRLYNWLKVRVDRDSLRMILQVQQ